MTTVACWAEPPSPRGVCRPRGGAERRSLAYRGLRLPPPSRGRIPPGLAGVWRVGLPCACERARGHSLTAVRLLPCAVRAAVCCARTRAGSPPAVTCGHGSGRSRLGALPPGSWFRDGPGGRVEVQTGPRGGGPVGFGPSVVGPGSRAGRRAKGAEAGRRLRASRDRSRAGGGGIPCTFTWRPGSRLRWCALPPNRSPRAAGRRPLGDPSALPLTFPPTLSLARLDG